MRSNTPRSYGSVERTLHWLTALVILSNVALGLLANRLPPEAMEAKVRIFSLHKTLGIAAFAVALIRILWVLSQPRPAPVHPERRGETLVAQTAHWLLYAAMLLVPLTGWIEHAATEGFAPILWPLGQSLPLVPKSPQLAEVVAHLHQTFAWTLILTVLLHVAGALKHAIVDRDGVLGRMVSGRPAGGAPAPSHVLPALAAAMILASGAGYALATAPPADGPGPALERVASDWTVTEGSIGFTVGQMGTPVSGRFDDWTAAIRFDERTGTGDATVTLNMDSVRIGTVSDQARGPAFFDVASHPTATFAATLRPEGDGFLAEGTLSMKGARIPVALPFTLAIADGVARMSGTTVLDRRDWHIGDSYADEGTVAFPVGLDIALTATR